MAEETDEKELMANDKKEPIKGEDLAVEMAPEVEAQIAADPAMGEFLKEVIARMRQALDGTTSEEDADEAMLKAGFERVMLEDDDDPE